MKCTQCREALSARLDGEEDPANADAVDRHLASCPSCRQFAADAARVTRLARTAVAGAEPDFTAAILTAAPRPRAWRIPLVGVVRLGLGLVGLAQVEVAIVALLETHASGLASSGVMLQGASLAHFAHESAAWNLALGVGFLWVAWRSSRTSGMVPTLTTFVGVLTVLVVLDALAGRVDTARFLLHGLVLAGLVLVVVLDRLHRPVGGSAPGVPAALYGDHAGPGQQADPPPGPGVDDLPPHLRPSARYETTRSRAAQYDATAVAARRSA